MTTRHAMWINIAAVFINLAVVSYGIGAGHPVWALNIALVPMNGLIALALSYCHE